jgi:hypothetical protein
MPVVCFAFVGPNHQIKTDVEVFAAALGHATRSGREIDVEYIPGPPDIVNRIQTVPIPGSHPLPPLQGDNGGPVEELSIQNAGRSTYTTAVIGTPGDAVTVETAIPMLELALQAAARNGIRVDIDYIAGARNTLTRVRLLDR